MVSLFIQKELKNIIQSPKFAATFLVCTVLILTSVFIGIREYQNTVAQYEANRQIVQEDARQASSWNRVRNIAHRTPDPMQIFVSGLHFDVGRLSSISTFSDVKLTRSPYSDEPIFAIFRFIDFAFIVQIVLSLFAILFTYDAINGERESGTLKLAFANSVSRVNYLLGKFVGIWAGLVIPLLIPVLLGLLLLMLFNIELSSDNWVAISSLIGLSVLYITFFIGLGLLVSSLTRHSSLSFLLLLVIWISSVMIIPRAGVIAAGQIVPIESVAQIEAKQAAFQKSAWDEWGQKSGDTWRRRNQEMEGMTPEERTAYRDDREWEWLEEDDKARKDMQQSITDNNRRLLEEVSNKKKQQEEIAFSLARLSPASSFRLAAMNIAATDIDLKNRYEESMRSYRDDFKTFVDKKQAESGNSGGFRMSFNSGSGISINTGRGDDTGIDTSEIPQYTSPEVTSSASIANSIFDFGLLGIFIVLCFGGTFIAFLKYDMR